MNVNGFWSQLRHLDQDNKEEVKKREKDKQVTETERLNQISYTTDKTKHFQTNLHVFNNLWYRSNIMVSRKIIK